MIKLNGSTDQYGFPTIPDVNIGNPFNGTAIKPPTIIDTGAGEIYLRPDLIELLKLEKISEAYTVHPIHGKQPASIYHAAIAIQGNEFGLIQVKPIIGSYPYDLILGCGFFRDWQLLYNGNSKTLEIII